MSDHRFFASLAKAGESLGKGLVAGLAGTLAITAGQKFFAPPGPVGSIYGKCFALL